MGKNKQTRLPPPTGRAGAGRQGFAMITVLMLAWLLFAFALSYFDVMVSEKKLLLSSENSLKAEAIAEAGMEETMWEYSYGGADFASVDGWSGTTTKTKTVGSYTDTDGNAVGSYTISVASWNTSTPLITVTSALTGAGTGTTATMKTQLTPEGIFTAAVKVQNHITFSGNAYTDSYNSASGSYGGANIYQNGDVVTNSTAIPAISLTGNALIKGDAATGSGGTVSDPSKVTGAVSSDANETISTNTVPAALVALPLLGSLSGSTTINDGSYKYTSLTLSGNDTIVINGAVTLYLDGSGTTLSTSGNANVTLNSGSTLTVYTDGNVSLSGNGIVNNNGTQSPSSAQIYGTSTCTSVQISGNASISGLVSAPQADTQISGNGNIYGAVIANQFTATGNAAIHYDENLQISGPSNGYKLQWHRRV